MPHDYRRRPCEERLKKIGQETINEKILFHDILEEYPTWRI